MIVAKYFPHEPKEPRRGDMIIAKYFPHEPKEPRRGDMIVNLEFRG